MALTERYFSTAAAGAGDGTTWADRAQLHNAGTWSSVLTGFDFSANGMRARIGPGTYTITAVLNAAAITAPPTLANPLVLHACDSSGVLWTPPNPAWTSNMPAWDDSTMPVLNTTTNIGTVTGGNTGWIARGLKFTASARQGAILSALSCSWCSVINSLANASSVAITSIRKASNCLFKCTGTSYSGIVTALTAYLLNCRIEGVAGSSGNRDGVISTATTEQTVLELCSILNVGGKGFQNTGANAGFNCHIARSLFYGCGGAAIVLPSTASQTANSLITGNYIAGNTGIGIDAGAANVIANSNRLRDNAGGNTANFGNYPTDQDNYTTDSDDATELVDVANGDYRIRQAANLIFGKGYGPADQLVQYIHSKIGI
jgi:hypothetical protein